MSAQGRPPGPGTLSLIQTPGNLARAAPHPELCKNARDRRGFGLVHSPLAGAAASYCGLDHVVAVGLAAGELALQRPPELSPPGFLPQVRQEELGHRAEKADMHCGDLAADGDRDIASHPRRQRGRGVLQRPPACAPADRVPRPQSHQSYGLEYRQGVAGSPGGSGWRRSLPHRYTFARASSGAAASR